MQTVQNHRFGVVNLMPYSRFHGRDRITRVTRDAYFDESFDSEQSLKDVSDWPHMNSEPIRRDGMYVVETLKTLQHDFVATLSFCPERPIAGRYEVRRPHGIVERGATLRVYPLREFETDPLVAKLIQFKIRHVVITQSEGQVRRAMLWLVGFNGFHSGDEADQSEMFVSMNR